MSDAYSFDIDRVLENERREATSDAIFNLDRKPDEGVRAMQLAQVAGVPAPVVLGDLEHYEKESRINVTQAIIADSPELQEYIRSNAMAATVSNADYANLADANDKVKLYSTRTSPAGAAGRSALRQAVPAIGSLPAIGAGAAAGAAAGTAAFPGVGTVIGGIVGGLAGGFGAGYGLTKLQDWLLSKAPNEWLEQVGLDLQQQQIDNLVHPTASFVGGLAPWALTFKPTSATLLQRGVSGAANLGIEGATQAIEGKLTPEHLALATLFGFGFANPNSVGASLLAQGEQAAARFGLKVEPYVREGKEPPVGLDPISDQIKVAEAQTDLDSLNEALRASLKSETRGLAPDLYADFVRQTTDGEIGVSPDAIRQLYGEKVPEPGDNILGWVPRIAEQLQAAEATGSDVIIPIADWLAKVDPQVAKALDGFIRTRANGVTVEEAKAGIDVWHGSPHEFTAFSSANIGSGEGAQSYGHGLYFAENQDVAKTYAVGRQTGGTIPVIIPDNPFSGAEILDVKPPSMYKARIKRAPEEFLDWDTPLDQQPAGQKLLQNMEPEFKAALEEILESHDQGELSSLTGNELRQLLRRWASEDSLPGVKTEPGQENFEKELAQYIADKGIPGIKYLDQGSREPKFTIRESNDVHPPFDDGGKTGYAVLDRSGTVHDMFQTRAEAEAFVAANPDKFAPQDTRNFVVFSDADIEIISRNGELIRDMRQAAGIEPKPMLARPQQLELPQEGTTRLEDRDPFDRGAALGITQDMYKRYLALMEKQLAEDTEWFTKKAVEAAKKKLSPEWKENEARVRQEVADDLRARPDFAADAYFREGTLFGEQAPKPKFDEELLTADQKALLPKSYYGPNGAHPDNLATLLGFHTGADLVEGLIALRTARGDTRSIDFFRREVAQETSRRMEEQYGSLRDKIVEEAKEHVLSETQVQLLHEESLAYAAAADLQFSLTKDQFVAAIKDGFNEKLLKEISSDDLMAASGRANRAAEVALLKQDFQEAFRQKQRSYIATVMAREAAGLEKLKGQLDKTALRFAAREVNSVERETQNYIQALLSQAGYSLKVSPKEIADSIAFEGTGTLADYVRSKAGLGWEPAVTDALQELGAKPIEQMTPIEFAEFKDAIDSLNFIGREEKKINVAGEKQEFADFRDRVVDNLKTLPARPRASQGRWLYQADAALTRMEEMIKDFDLRQELGPMFRAVIEPLMASKTKEFDLLQDLSDHFRKVRGDFGRKWQKSLQDTVPNDFIIDPYTNTPYDLTRENLINIMLNWGTRSNIEKFSKGYAAIELGRKASPEEAFAFEMRTKALIDANATKQDWDFVEAMWAPFKKLQGEADTVSRNVSGIAPKWIDGAPIDTPFGTIEGNYWPVKYDRLGSNLQILEDKPHRAGGLFNDNFFRAATAKNYLKERTGYIDAVDITSSIEAAGGTLQQTIHDIAFRDSLVQAGKVFYDKEIRANIRKHYGIEYEDQMIPWLKRIANRYSADEKAIRFYNDWQRRVRTNLIGHALPLNLKVIFSPDIGVPNPKSWASFEANRTENMKLALEKSNEIRHMVYNMDRDFREQMERVGEKAGFDALQKNAVRWGFKPMMKVSQEFRAATFVDQFNKAMADGRSEHEASVIADSYVRERHGAASVVDLPAIMESNETMKSLTMFYGYFNTMYNWQRQLPGNVRRGEFKEFGVNALGSILVGAGFGALLFNEQKRDDGWFKTIGKALLLQPLSTIPIVRDAANYFFEGHSARTPTVGLINSVSAAYTDVKDAITKRREVKKPIAHAANLIGVTTGLPLLQIGRTSQFAADVMNRKQRPKNFAEWARGIISGQAELKK